MDRIELVEEYPAKIADMLLNDQVDVGLVPVAIIPSLQEAHIVTDYCIGAGGEVASVALFSEVPIEQVTKVLLDYQSKTSVNLARILFERILEKRSCMGRCERRFSFSYYRNNGGYCNRRQGTGTKKISAYLRSGNCLESTYRFAFCFCSLGSE
jgi:hypothetical protein